jgi:hypothetical protein
MAQNTALQEFIERLTEAKNSITDTSDYARGMKAACEIHIVAATELLPKERQDIIDGFNQGYREGETDSNDNGGKLPIDVCQYDDANNYFIQTFTLKQKIEAL